ncbi:MAG: Crp/Fnr family transcriptional regulator [Dehalobacterium sp.]
MEDRSKELVEFITQSIYFGDTTLQSEGMSAEVWEKYLYLGCKEYRNSGDYIMRIGDNVHGLYFIKKGKVKSNLLSKDGTEKILSIKSENTIFAEQFIFHHQPGVFEVVALEDSELYFFTRDTILQLMQKDFEITLFIGKSLSITSRMLAHQVQDMSVRSILQGLARILYSICCYEINKSSKSNNITFILTHEELANMLGAHRVTVTKNLNYLKSLGIIDYKYEKITIKNREELKKIASE